MAFAMEKKGDENKEDAAKDVGHVRFETATFALG
jgi:hypothetical protein